MSNDTMPCGCEGHADNTGLCRYPGLEAAFAAERKRREDAERQAAENWGAYQRKAEEGATNLARAEKAEATLSRLQAMPEMEWARVTSIISQTLARLARTDQPEAKALLSALDQGKVHVGRLRDRAEQAEDVAKTAEDGWRACAARLEQAELGESAEKEVRLRVLHRAEQAEQDAETLRRNLADAQKDNAANAEALEQAERERDSNWILAEKTRQRAERAEADNAALLRAITEAIRQHREEDNPKECQCGAEEGTNVEEHDRTCLLRFLEPRVGGPILGGDHPGAALLEWMRKQDGDILRMAEEIEAWKSATRLERGGDPDGVRPADLARELERMRALEGWAQTAAQGYSNLVELGVLKGGYAVTAKSIADEGRKLLKAAPKPETT